MTAALKDFEVKYSQRVKGDRGNYDWSARFNISGRGYLGITQYDGDSIKERVLLSPTQVRELRAFLNENK